MSLSRKFKCLVIAGILFCGICAAESPESFSLSNGIKIYNYKNQSSRTGTVNILVKGGVKNYGPEFSGLEDALFYMMCDSSVKYDKKSIMTFNYKTSSVFDYSTGSYGSYIYTSFVDSYFEQSLDILTEGFLNPSYSKQGFDQLIQLYQNKIQKNSRSEEAQLFKNMRSKLYKGNLLETQTTPDENSLLNITVENLKLYHSFVMDPQNISVVVVGNLKKSKLKKLLESKLGSIKKSASSAYFGRDENFISQKCNFTNSSEMQENSNSFMTSYLLKVYPMCNQNHKDYMASKIAADMYSSQLYNVVREKYGACYTPSCFTTSGDTGLGFTYIFKGSDIQNMNSYINEATELMMENKFIISKTLEGDFSFASIQDCVESYKNKFFTGTYEGISTNSGRAGYACSSLLRFGDPEKLLELTESVSMVTGEQVLDVFRKYWGNQSDEFEYFAVASPEKADECKKYWK